MILIQIMYEIIDNTFILNFYHLILNLSLLSPFYNLFTACYIQQMYLYVQSK